MTSRQHSFPAGIEHVEIAATPPSAVNSESQPAAGPASRRWPYAVLAALAGLGLILGWAYWNANRPARRFERGLRALIKKGERVTALREARELLGVPGFEPQSHLLSGTALADGGWYNQALEELQQVPESSALVVRALTLAAKCHYQLGQFPETVTAARKALERDETALDARRWLVAAYYDLGALAHTVEQLKLISQAAPDDGRPDRLLGLIEKDHEAYQQAIEYYQESLRRNPQPADRNDILTELAQSQIKLSQFEAALKALADCDETSETLALAAECHIALGRPDAARSAVDRALSTNPDDFTALLVNADIRLSEGLFQPVVDALQRALRQQPYNAQAHFKLSQAYARLGEREKSDEQLALMKDSQNLADEFTSLYQRATQEIGNVETRYRLGVVARKLGDLELAKIWYRAALAIEPTHAPSRAALNQVETELRERQDSK